MVEHLPPFLHLRRAGHLAPLDGDVVPARVFRIHADFAQGPDHGAHVFLKAADPVFFRPAEEGKIDVAQVVIDGPSARGPAYDAYAMAPAEFLVDFSRRVLVPPHDDRGLIAPGKQHARMPGTQGLEEGFFQGEIEEGVGAFGMDCVHGAPQWRDRSGRKKAVRFRTARKHMLRALTSCSGRLPAGTWAGSGRPERSPWRHRRTPGSSMPIPPSWERIRTSGQKA